MKNHIQYVKDKLMESINSLESLKGMYVRHANKDFTRTRALPFSTMIKLILEMEGGALGHELRHYFSFSVTTPTISKSYAGTRDTTVAKGRRFARLAQKPRQVILDYGKSLPGYWVIYHTFEE